MIHVIAVCDHEEQYVTGLTDYLNMKEGFPYVVRAFTSPQALYELHSVQKIEFILMEESLYDSLPALSDREGIILLRESGMSRYPQIKSIYKYQSCERLIHELYEIMSLQPASERLLTRTRGLQLIGFYSPVKRCLQTTLALTMGQLLGERKRVIYLNMETLSGLSYILGKDFSKDLSDLFYQIQEEKRDIACLIESMTEQINHLSVLPAMKFPTDLIQISAKQWIQLFTAIEAGSEYEILLIDLSDGVQGVFDILCQCDRIYTIRKDDRAAKEKEKQYRDLLQQSKYQSVREKSREIYLPDFIHLPRQADRLLYSEVADFIKDFWNAEEELLF